MNDQPEQKPQPTPPRKPSSGCLGSLFKFFLVVFLLLVIGYFIPRTRHSELGAIAGFFHRIQEFSDKLARIVEQVDKELSVSGLPMLKAHTNTIILDVGLTNELLRSVWHRTPEGSDVFPAALFRALPDPVNGRPIVENLMNYGFTPDPDDDTGLPVGFSHIRTGDFVMTGINCAACHSTQISYQGHTMHIDGGPNQVDVQLFYERVRTGLEKLLRLEEPEKFATFVIRFIKYNEMELKNSPHLPQGPINIELDDDGMKLFMAFLKNKLQTLQRIEKSFSHQTEAGPGRADSFGIIRNMLMMKPVTTEDNFMPMTAPVSIPHLFGFNTFTNLHCDGNTTSPFERNFAQAVALGADFNPDDFTSSVDPTSLFQLEEAARLLHPPKWPELILGKLDTNKVARGKTLFRSAGCIECHAHEGWHSLDIVGTDPNRIDNYNTALQGAEPSYAKMLAVGSQKLEQRAFELAKISPEAQKKMAGWHEGVPTVWIQTKDKGYFTRPLLGLWATAPYLHNGSVPTLYDLLQPAANRPKKFALGQREYDPKKVGFVEDVAKPSWTFNATLPGNLNTGHEFGTKLSEDDKWSLIEYLKTL